MGIKMLNEMQKQFSYIKSHEKTNSVARERRNHRCVTMVTTFDYVKVGAH